VTRWLWFFAQVCNASVEGGQGGHDRQLLPPEHHPVPGVPEGHPAQGLQVTEAPNPRGNQGGPHGREEFGQAHSDTPAESEGQKDGQHCLQGEPEEVPGAGQGGDPGAAE